MIDAFVFKWLQLNIDNSELLITFQEPSATNTNHSLLAQPEIG